MGTAYGRGAHWQRLSVLVLRRQRMQLLQATCSVQLRGWDQTCYSIPPMWYTYRRPAQPALATAAGNPQCQPLKLGLGLLHHTLPVALLQTAICAFAGS